MSQCDIVRSCGHVETVNITGTDVRGERGRRAAWLARQPCTDCASAARQAGHDQVNELAAELADIQDLPELVGSDKQVAWAMTLRADALAAVEDLLAKAAASPKSRPERDQQIGQLYRDVLLRQTSAREWIDARNLSLGGLLHCWMTADDKAAYTAMTN